MSAESTRYLELLEERLALLGSLANALTAARLDIVALDIDGLEARISEQDQLCAQIRALDLQLDRVQLQCRAHLGVSSPQRNSASPDPAATRQRETLDRLIRAQANVKQLNNEHQALLRRSRRTVNALLNSYHSFALTYSNPADEHVAVGDGR